LTQQRHGVTSMHARNLSDVGRNRAGQFPTLLPSGLLPRALVTGWMLQTPNCQIGLTRPSLYHPTLPLTPSTVVSRKAGNAEPSDREWVEAQRSARWVAPTTCSRWG
jgi:hypothetical protein